MTIYQEDFAPACTKPGCEHADEGVTLAPSCHPATRILDAKPGIAAVGLATKVIYSLATNEMIVRCAVCDAVVCTVAVARRSPNLTMVKANGTHGPVLPAPPPQQPKRTKKRVRRK